VLLPSLIVPWKLLASAVKVDDGGVVGVGLSLEQLVIKPAANVMIE
jgi:hypothetical protein